MIWFLFLIFSPLCALETLDPYREYLEEGTYQGQDWSSYEALPLSRYHSFKFAFEYFIENDGHVVVELGTSRSFVHGGLLGCNEDDPKYWTPDQPQNWDWGAGFFTRMVAESLQEVNPQIHTVDLCRSHIDRCQIMTEPFKSSIHYHVSSSVDFLNQVAPHSIDLLYLDTGDMWPIEPTAILQLEEAMVIVKRDLLAENGIILIDDVRNQTPKKFGETSDLGKSKYAIPYLLREGYEIIFDGYQVILRR